MIYIVTVHHKSEAWVPIQLRFLRLNVQEPYTVVSWIDKGLGLELQKAGPVYHQPFRGSGSANHAAKLDFLAGEVCRISRQPDTDLIVFLDGDAFPIRPKFIQVCRDWSGRDSLVAVRRDEGPSPLIPHPSCCASTVSFWKELPGQWQGLVSQVGDVQVRDTGCRLYKRLCDKMTRWQHLSRTNSVNLDPLYFGIYGNMVYHHGAGFRPSAGPGWYDAGATGYRVHALSSQVLKLIQDHDDFWELFTRGKYKDQIKVPEIGSNG